MRFTDGPTTEVDVVVDASAARVWELLSDIDLPARLCGEEFAVLLFESELQGALSFAERFRAHLRELAVPSLTGRTVQVTASVGVAVGTDLIDADALIEAADRALYQAKSEGRDRMVDVSLTPAIPASESAERKRA